VLLLKTIQPSCRCLKLPISERFGYCKILNLDHWTRYVNAFWACILEPLSRHLVAFAFVFIWPFPCSHSFIILSFCLSVLYHFPYWEFILFLSLVLCIIAV
jgi:hypothetical protein